MAIIKARNIVIFMVIANLMSFANVRRIQAIVWETEPNDSYCDAIDVNVIRTDGSHRGTLANIDDEDFWLFPNEYRGLVTIVFTSGPTGSELYMSLYDWSCRCSGGSIHDCKFYGGVSMGVGGNYNWTIDSDGHYIDVSTTDKSGGYEFSVMGDPSLPVELSFFTAITGNGKVILRWRTESEVNNVGFGIYRSDAKNGQYVKIGWRDGAGNSAMPNEYKYLDKTAKQGQVYYYYIEDIDVEGIRTKSHIVKSVNKKNLTATWGLLKKKYK